MLMLHVHALPEAGGGGPGIVQVDYDDVYALRAARCAYRAGGA